MFYVNLMVTAKQKPIVNTQKIQNSKHTTMENYQVTEEKRERPNHTTKRKNPLNLHTKSKYKYFSS